MSRSPKDDFPIATKRALAARVGHLCSNPECHAPTSGPRLNAEKSTTAGDAAHITAASPEGPRHDRALTSAERRHANNGIWLCVVHARIIDQDTSRYTVTDLRRWKLDAEAEAHAKLGRPQLPGRVASAKAPPDDDVVKVQNFLASYRKLLLEGRGYILGLVMILIRLPDLAAWRRAQVDGTLRQFQETSRALSSFWTRPETAALVGSVSDVAPVLKAVSLDPTKDDFRARAAATQWGDLLLRLGDHGPQSDAEVSALQQAGLSLLDARLTAQTAKERVLTEVAEKWIAGREAT